MRRDRVAPGVDAEQLGASRASAGAGRAAAGSSSSCRRRSGRGSRTPRPAARRGRARRARACRRSAWRPLGPDRVRHARSTPSKRTRNPTKVSAARAVRRSGSCRPPRVPMKRLEAAAPAQRAPLCGPLLWKVRTLGPALRRDTFSTAATPSARIELVQALRRRRSNQCLSYLAVKGAAAPAARAHVRSRLAGVAQACDATSPRSSSRNCLIVAGTSDRDDHDLLGLEVTARRLRERLSARSSLNPRRARRPGAHQEGGSTARTEHSTTARRRCDSGFTADPKKIRSTGLFTSKRRPGGRATYEAFIPDVGALRMGLDDDERIFTTTSSRTKEARRSGSGRTRSPAGSSCNRRLTVV